MSTIPFILRLYIEFNTCYILCKVLNIICKRFVVKTNQILWLQSTKHLITRLLLLSPDETICMNIQFWDWISIQKSTKPLREKLISNVFPSQNWKYFFSVILKTVQYGGWALTHDIINTDGFSNCNNYIYYLQMATSVLLLVILMFQMVDI